ncbi:C2 domain containing protein [Tritrichomonas foetus]|uniref:C2 domain containing protein n=1 Tax=Tritrichomonas foetus TaxID=1144522 RepID=A0A1J4JNH0_9EUKA|nr:C2 domain containing protein [Tritrichomonas foetus]|eukprot:OHT00627.1 C2 domain containing protein [Tritrichomonas foetus]
MTFLLKVLEMRHHPVKRHPLPYIYASVQSKSVQEPKYTEKTNSIPPSWNHKTFIYGISGVANDEVIRVTVYESRLFMYEESLGHVDIQLASLPMNQLIFQWAHLTPDRESLPPMEILLMITLHSNDQLFNENAEIDDYFNVDPAERLNFEPWNPNEVEMKYLKRTPLEGILPPEEEAKNSALIDFSKIKKDLEME